MSTTPNNAAKENTTTSKDVQLAVIDTKLPILNRIDERSLDLQSSISNFSLFYGDVAEPPSVHEQKILNSYDLLVLDFDKVACKNLSKLRKEGGRTLARVSLITGGDGCGSAVAIDIDEPSSDQKNTGTPSPSPASPSKAGSSTPSQAGASSSSQVSVSSPSKTPQTPSKEPSAEIADGTVPPPPPNADAKNPAQESDSTKDGESVPADASEAPSSSAPPPPPPLPPKPTTADATTADATTADATTADATTADATTAPDSATPNDAAETSSAPPPPPPLPTPEQLAKAGSSNPDTTSTQAIPPPPPLPTAEQLAKTGSSSTENVEASGNETPATTQAIPPPAPLPTAEELAKTGSSNAEGSSEDKGQQGIPPPPPLPTAEQLAKAGSGSSEEPKPIPPPPPPPLPTAEQLAKAGTSAPAEITADPTASSSSAPAASSSSSQPSSSADVSVKPEPVPEPPKITVIASRPKPKISAVASIAKNHRHKSSHKAFTNAERLLRQVKNLSDKEGIDGIYITDIDKAVEEFGIAQVESAVAHMIDEANKAKYPMMLFVDGGAFFVESAAWLPELAHGVIIPNPTLEERGEFKLLPRRELTEVLDVAKIQSQRRVDFITLAHETVELDKIRSGMVRRFVKYCQETKMVPNLSVDPTMTRPEMVHSTPANPSGPMAVFSSPYFDDYFKIYRSVCSNEGKHKTEESWQKVIVREVIGFAKSVGYDLDQGAFGETLIILREKHKQNAYIVWIGLLSTMFQILSEKAGAQDERHRDVFEEASNIFIIFLRDKEYSHDFG